MQSEPEITFRVSTFCEHFRVSLRALSESIVREHVQRALSERVATHFQRAPSEYLQREHFLRKIKSVGEGASCLVSLRKILRLLAG